MRPLVCNSTHAQTQPVGKPGHDRKLFGRPRCGPCGRAAIQTLLSWQTAAAIATASVGVGAVLLHAIGSIRHNVFLAQFGMDADLFPSQRIG
jgi:hypothetical protein